MKLEPFVGFRGNCREAVDFYAKVFQTEAPKFMTFRDMPPGEDMELSEADKDLIMYTDLTLFGVQVMFCDVPSVMPFVLGNNISLTLITDDEAEIRRLFHELSAGGEVDVELQKTFWARLFASVTDRFGIQWQLSHDGGSEAMDGKSL
jgi:PhnB protein